MKKSIAIILGMSLMLCTPVAFAQLLVEEGKIKLTVDPGQTEINTLTVHNTSKEPFHVKAYWQDFRYIEPFDGKKEFLPSGSLPNSLAGWALFSPQEFD